MFVYNIVLLFFMFLLGCCECGKSFDVFTETFNVLTEDIACDKADYFTSLIITNRTFENEFIVENIKEKTNFKYENVLKLWNKFNGATIMENSTTIGLKCDRFYKNYLERLKRNEYSAVKMFDANAKLPSGILSGNINQYGDFDECFEVNGKYCLADVLPTWKEPFMQFKHAVHSNFIIKNKFGDPGHRIPGFSTIKWGFCIPKQCSNKDLENAIEEKLGFKSNIKSSLCQISKKIPKQNTVGEYIAKTIFVLILMCVGASSFIYRKFPQKNLNKKWFKLLMAFSLQTNFNELVTIKENNREIRAVHGVRALAALALLISHKTMSLLYNPYINRTYMAETYGMKWSVIGRTAIIYTDCFLLVSGLLNANTMFSDLDKSKSLKFKDKIINRLFRILPNLIAVILFCTYLLPEMGSGPLWPAVINHHSELCKNYMWRNMLLIHNYFGFENMCLTHTHQVGIDMQLFLATPPFVYLIWKTKRVGLYVLGFVAAVSTVLRFWATWYYSLSHVVHFGIPISRMFDTANFSYILPTHRATIYLTGVLLAYILRYTRKNTNFSKFQLFSIWSLLYILAFSAWFGPINMSLTGYEYNKLEAAIYGALSPIFWGLGVAWVIYSTNRGFGSWLGHILTWKYFETFTKIAYAVYLVQFPIFFYNVGITRHSDEYKSYMMLQIVETGFIISISIILTLCVEMPFQNIRKIIFSTGAMKNSKKIEEK